MIDDDLDPLIARADLDGLVRLIDSRCATRDWEGLLRVRDRSRFALETGRQLWPAATLAEYRIALHAPAEWAARVLDEDGGRFSIGPLTEVVAQNHSWSELADLLPEGPRRSFVAHERVLRGEVVRPSLGDGSVLDIPLELQAWEPAYALPTYSDHGIDNPCPADIWAHVWMDTQPTNDQLEQLDDPDIESAFRSLVEPWTTSSNGRAETMVVAGEPADALHALGIGRAKLTRITGGQALKWLAWCGASGGAHGRRRGGALGRFGVWWMLAAIGGFIDEWDDLMRNGQLGNECGDVVTSFEWYRFDDGSHSGHELSLIAHETGDDQTSDDETGPLSIVLLARDHPSTQ